MANTTNTKSARSANATKTTAPAPFPKLKGARGAFGEDKILVFPPDERGRISILIIGGKATAKGNLVMSFEPGDADILADILAKYAARAVQADDVEEGSEAALPEEVDKGA